MELTKVNAQDIIPGNVIYALKGNRSMVLLAVTDLFETKRVLRNTLTNTDVPLDEITDWDLYALGHKVSSYNGYSALITPGAQEFSVGDFVVEVLNSDHSRYTGIVVGVGKATTELVCCYYEYGVSPSGRSVSTDNLIVDFINNDIDIVKQNYKKIDYKDSTFSFNEEKIIGKLALSVGPDAVSKLLVALDKVEGRND